MDLDKGFVWTIEKSIFRIKSVILKEAPNSLVYRELVKNKSKGYENNSVLFYMLYKVYIIYWVNKKYNKEMQYI